MFDSIISYIPCVLLSSILKTDSTIVISYSPPFLYLASYFVLMTLEESIEVLPFTINISFGFWGDY